MNNVVFWAIILIGSFWWFVIRPNREYILYSIVKADAIRVAKKAPALMSFPFLMFLELQLDMIYEEKGLEGAIEAIRKWPEEYQKTLEDAMNGIRSTEIMVKLPGKDMKSVPVKHEQPNTGPVIYMGPPIIPLRFLLKEAGWEKEDDHVVTVNGRPIKCEEEMDMNVTSRDVIVIKNKSNVHDTSEINKEGCIGCERCECDQYKEKVEA